MILKIWTATLILKLFAAYWFPFFADEAYYWVWSKHLALSYYDHPPFIAWLLKLGQVFDGFGHAARWPVVIFGHFSILVWVEIMRKWLSEKDLFLFFLLLTLSFITGLGPAIATPDAPLMLFWPLALLSVFRALETKKLSWYIAVGIFCGLGFCSKYNMALFLPVVCIWFTLEKKWPEVNLKYLGLTFVFFAVFSSPVFIWNYLNDFVSFRFQLNHGFAKNNKENWTLDYIGSQIGLMFPTLLFLAVSTTLKFKTLSEKRWLIYFAWLIPLLFLFSSTRGRVEANWTAVALPAIFALALLSNFSRIWIKATLWIWAFAIIVLVSEAWLKWLPIDEKRLKTSEYYAFDDFLSYPEKYKPFYASSYQMASMLYYKTKTPVYKLQGTHRMDQFDLWKASRPNSDSFFVLFGVWNNYPDYLKEYKEQQVLPDHKELRLMGYTK